MRFLGLMAAIGALTLVSGCSLLKDFDFEEEGDCTGGLVDCDGVCVDLQTDRLACGTCGNVCEGTTEFCDTGSCHEMIAARSSHHFFATNNGNTPISAIASAPDRGFFYGLRHSDEVSLQEVPTAVPAPADNAESNFGKYAANGNINWANGIIGSGSEQIYDVSATPDGAAAVGYFTTLQANGGANFFDSMGIIDNHSANVGGGMGYVWSVNADGTHKWWQDIRGSTSVYNYHVEVDDAGNVYVAGYFRGSLEVAGSMDLSGGLTVGYFVTRFRANGASDWTTVIDLTSSTPVDSMVVDSTGRVYLWGSGSGTVDVGGDVVVLPANTPTLFAVDATGVVFWEHYDSATTSTAGRPGVAMTSDDRLFVTFDVNDPSSAIGDILLGAGGTLVELDPTDGTPLGDTAIMNDVAVTPYELGVDDDDNLTLVGSIVGTDVDLGGGSITLPGTDSEALVVSYTSDGDYRYARTYGTSLNDVASRGVVHPDGRVTTAGSFNETVAWEGVMLTPAGGTGSDTYFVAHDPVAATP